MHSELHFWTCLWAPDPGIQPQNQPAGVSLPKPHSGEAAAQSWSFFPQLALLCTHTSLIHMSSQLNSTGFSQHLLASQGRQLTLFMRSLPQSLLHQHSLHQEQALCWAPTVKLEPGKGPWGWDSGKSFWETQTEREFAT